MSDSPATWTTYQAAIGALYDRPAAESALRGGGEVAASADLADRAQAVIDQSREMGLATAARLGAAEADRRELAGLQLMAAAAADLAMASDLMRAAEDTVPADVAQRGPAFSSALNALGPVLSASPEAGMRGLMGAELAAVRTGAPADLPAARQALRDSVEVTMPSIRDGAATAAQALIVGLTTLPLPPIQSAVSAAAQEILTRLAGSVSLIVRRAADLVASAITKILDAIGPAAAGEARNQAAQWLREIQQGGLLGNILDKLYEPNRIRADVDRLIETDGVAVEALNAAGRSVQELRTKFSKQKDVLIWVARGLAWARAWILGLQPWGPIALTTAYLGGIGYTVYLGGDYIDWFRTGPSERLCFVPGVRTVVRQAIAGTTP